MEKTETMRDIELRVAAYNALTPEQARELYAAYVKRGLEVDRCREIAERDGADYSKAVDALRTLRNEVSGLVRAHGPAIRADAGNTNLECIELALSKADAILAPADLG